MIPDLDLVKPAQHQLGHLRVDDIEKVLRAARPNGKSGEIWRQSVEIADALEALLPTEARESFRESCYAEG